MMELMTGLVIAVVVLALALSLTMLSVPLLWWLALRHATELVRLQRELVLLRADVDKLDAVLDGMLSVGRAPE